MTVVMSTGETSKRLKTSFAVWDDEVLSSMCDHFVIPQASSKNSLMEWLSGVEDQLGVGPNLGVTAICEETGMPYVEIAIDHLGSPTFTSGCCAYFESESDACMAWAGAFDRYQRAHEGKLFWRCKPDVRFVEGGGWRVYARLVIAPEVMP
jgi:hypothetical protein